jgi:hypothetical protein
MSGLELFKDKMKDDKNNIFIKLNFLFTLILIFLTFTASGKQYFLKSSDDLTSKASERDFCKIVIKQLIEKKLSEQVVSPSLYQIITAENYKNLFFEGSEIVSGVWSGENQCKILVKTKDSIRSFDFTYEESLKFKYFYVLTKIHENDFYEKE